MDIRDGNDRMMRLASIVLNSPQPIFSIKEIVNYSRECDLSLSEGFAFLIAAALGLDQEQKPEDRELFEQWIKPCIHLSDVKQYYSDPFYKAIPALGQAIGNWTYENERIRPGELFVEGDLRITSAGRVLPQLGFFSEEYSFPAVFENGSDWMSLAPNETVTLKQPIENAYGRVLTYGLGLGYYAFMTSRKPNVESVTIVERDESANLLFTKYILPHFEFPNKIHLICADAIKYAENIRDDTYDCIFADFWRDAGDGIPQYKILKPLEKNAPHTHFSYWIEKSMDIYLDPTLWP